MTKKHLFSRHFYRFSGAFVGKTPLRDPYFSESAKKVRHFLDLVAQK
jgi:hypothetical protein